MIGGARRWYKPDCKKGSRHESLTVKKKELGMAKSEGQIKREIKDYIDERRSPYPSLRTRSWYVGISEDPEGRLFNDHGVDKESDPWIYRTAKTSAAARRIERYFVETLGTDGGPGGGDLDTRAVYAYKKQAHTDP